MNFSRRQFLASSTFSIGSVAVSSFSWGGSRIFSSQGHQEARSLSLYNIHTGETFKETYWEKGGYCKEALSRLDYFMRDRRCGTIHTMDPHVVDLLHKVQHTVGNQCTPHIVCGYRSPNTNAKLHQYSRGVARNSKHMQGQAIDFYIPGCNVLQLKKIAASFKAGGVGYYPASGFIHVDIRDQPAYW